MNKQLSLAESDTMKAGQSGGASSIRDYTKGLSNSGVRRKCMAYPPEQISAETLTHINFAFALIESGCVVSTFCCFTPFVLNTVLALSSSFRIIEMTNGDTELWKRTTALKSRNPTLKVYLSIGT